MATSKGGIITLNDLPYTIMAETKSEDGRTLTLTLMHHETIHLCPPKGGGLFPCCGRTPFEVPRTDRMTLEKGNVTCGKGAT